jgi:hypothetical protein
VKPVTQKVNPLALSTVPKAATAADRKKMAANNLQSVQVPLTTPKLQQFEDTEIDAELALLNNKFGDIKKKPDQQSMMTVSAIS